MDEKEGDLRKKNYIRESTNKKGNNDKNNDNDSSGCDNDLGIVYG